MHILQAADSTTRWAATGLARPTRPGRGVAHIYMHSAWGAYAARRIITICYSQIAWRSLLPWCSHGISPWRVKARS